MRYDELRNSLLLVLRDADLFTSFDRPAETIELEGMSRGWKSTIGSGSRPEVEPFHAYGEVSFRWDALDSARTQTMEEDVVTELFGRDEELPETMERLLRIDLVLHAKLPWDSKTPMPEGALWRSWSQRVDEELSSVLAREVAELQGDPLVVMGSLGSVEVESRCSPEGDLRLSGVSLSSWQTLVLPRIRDGFDSDPDVDVDRELEDLAEGYRIALDLWMGCVADLRERL